MPEGSRFFSLIDRALTGAAFCVFCVAAPLQTEAQTSSRTEAETSGAAPAPTGPVVPGIPDLLDQLARTEGEQGERLAREIQRRWAISESDTANLFLNWSERAMEDGDLPTALDMLDQVILIAPGFAEGYHRRGALHYQAENIGAAIQDLYTVLRLEPRHYGALVGLASSLAHLGEDEQAFKLLERAYEVNPGYDQGRTLYDSLFKEREGNRI